MSRQEDVFNFLEPKLPAYIPTYEFTGGALLIDDPVWGKEEIGSLPGDEIFLELLHNPLIRRSMAIEQLTLGPDAATIPGTASFSRWEHIWGSVVFVRKMLHDSAIPAREQTLMQLRTFVSDLGHTAFSHLGDWMFQGSGGAENQHDNELLNMLEVSGVTDVLRRYGYDTDAIIFPPKNDWIECPAPDLCVDRVDYGAREIRRWLANDPSVRNAVSLEAFRLDGESIIMSDIDTARSFAKAFLLLSTEHWSEPVHRLQLRFQEELVKQVVSGKYARLTALNALDRGDYHPRDLLYAVDGDITRETYFSGSDFSTHIKRIMQEIGAAKRHIFITNRLGQLGIFFADPNASFPDPIKNYGSFSNALPDGILQPINVVIEPKDAVDMTNIVPEPGRLDIFLPALKPRQIDPLFRDADGIVQRLSDRDQGFKETLAQQATLMKRSYIAQVYLSPEIKRSVEEGMEQNNNQWQEAIQRPHMPTHVLKDILRNSVGVAAAHRMIDLRWND